MERLDSETFVRTAPAECLSLMSASDIHQDVKFGRFQGSKSYIRNIIDHFCEDTSGSQTSSIMYRPTSKSKFVDHLVQWPGRAYRGTNVGLLLVHGAVLTRCPSCCHQCLVWEPVWVEPRLAGHRSVTLPLSHGCYLLIILTTCYKLNSCLTINMKRFQSVLNSVVRVVLRDNYLSPLHCVLKWIVVWS